MIGESSIYGVLVPNLLLCAVMAGLLQVAIRQVLGVVGFYRFVWHRALFDLALYIMALGAVVLFVSGFNQV